MKFWVLFWNNTKQRQLKNTEVSKKVLDEDLEKEVVIPKKAKEGCCGGAAWFPIGLRQYLHLRRSPGNRF